MTASTTAPESAHTIAIPDDLKRLAQEASQPLSLESATVLELGKKLVELKEIIPHGQFCKFVTEQLGIDSKKASRMKAAALKFPEGTPRRSLSTLGVGKLYELMTQSDESLDALANGESLAGYTLDEIKGMPVRKLREILKANAQVYEIPPEKIKRLESFATRTTATESPATKASAPAAPSKVIYLDEEQDQALNLPLQPGDRIRSLHAKRTGHVVRVYNDGSAAIHWDDREPQPEGLAHERMPRSLLELVKRPNPAADRDRRKSYCRELCRTITRYATDAEMGELARAIEEVSAAIQTRRYAPGLNAASYEVFRRYAMKGGAQ